MVSKYGRSTVAEIICDCGIYNEPTVGLLKILVVGLMNHKDKKDYKWVGL